MPCQTRLIDELIEPLTDDFGYLFTAWVLIAFDRYASLGARMPDSALRLFSPACRAELSPSTRVALSRTKISQHGTTAEEPGIDVAAAMRALFAMKPAQRRAVLDDVMDGLIGDIITLLGIH
uniref:hypothetical protein n=1 Tax=Streptomyces sp. CA-136453 TaxID=3240050 RepID=UPI003F4985E8